MVLNWWCCQICHFVCVSYGPPVNSYGPLVILVQRPKALEIILLLRALAGPH